MTVPVEPVEVDALTWTINGDTVLGGLVESFADAANSLSENITFFVATPDNIDADANWLTYFSVRVGFDKPASGDWSVYVKVKYGTPYDEQSPFGKARPYYSRLTIVLEVGATSITLDTDGGSANVIGNGHGIPPTFFNYDPVAGTVSNLVEGHTLAFIESIRIDDNPNRTGLQTDGDLCLRYDHAIDNEGHPFFYAIHCWPGQFDDKTGAFTRGDVPGAGQAPTSGFCCGEEGPYSRVENWGSKIYQIEHIHKGSGWTDDRKKWSGTATWRHIPRESRGVHGISGFVGNLKSRGSDSLRDFGYAWGLMQAACRQLQMWPSPVNPHTTNAFMYNYDTSAMRAKGWILATMTYLREGLELLLEVRDTSTREGAEVAELSLACADRGAEMLQVLKRNYDNNAWKEFDTDQYGRYYSPYMIGHYFQGLLIMQEAIFDLTGQNDTKIDEMMVTLAEEAIDDTLLWVNNGPHPNVPSATYTGGYDGYRMPYRIHDTLTATDEDTSITDKLTIVYEWAQENGVRNGSKLDAIVTQHSGQNYKWKLGAQTGGKTKRFKIAATNVLTAAVGIDHIDYKMSIAATIAHTASVAMVVTGGNEFSREGDAIAVNSVSIGASIAVGPGYHAAGDATFTVNRNTDYQQPFVVSIGASRSLTGDEVWRASIRKTKSGAVLASFTSADGSIAVDGVTFQPSIVFTPAKFANIAAGSEGEYFYDLEMLKGSNFETYAVDVVTIAAGPASTAWRVVRGDHYRQPFTVGLDQSRTLDGSEQWTATMRTSTGATPTVEFSTGAGTIIADPTTRYPKLVFTPATFASVPAGDDLTYVYDLRMSKAGKFETLAFAGATIVGDLSR